MTTVAIEDLSLTHKLVGKLFEQPKTTVEWNKYRLSKEQVDFYKENGYLADIKLLNEQQIDVLRKELSGLFNPEQPGNELFYEYHSNQSSDASKVIFHALGAWRITEGFHDILWNPAFTMAASQLMDDSHIRFWHDQLFCKPAKHGGVVAWHQDYSYWTRTTPMQHLTCWTGLDDAKIENGCLYYVPGSHRWGLIDKPELTGDMDGIQAYLTAEQKANFKPIPIKLKAGHATFHHPLMVHGSYANTSEKQRRAVVLNVFKDGTVSNSDEEILKSVPAIKLGEKMEGQFFPLIY
jgi:ectoine hydroxylase-related dioxygenase (phytanoyl-CoA dioxygenase family)